MPDRITCGGLMERGDLCLVEVLGCDRQPRQARLILGKFSRAGISLSYLSIGNGPEGDKNMSFCLGTAELAEHRQLLEDIRTEFTPARIDTRAPVVILTLYGPHFLEKNNIASEVFSALCDRDIDAHTVCSSVNSISVVVDSPDRDRTVECLGRKFDWPD